jgi:hypothetical protein
MANEQLRSQQIEAILSTNKTDFINWRNQTGTTKTLVIPQDLARAFIPRRILELSQDPSKVKALLVDGSESAKASSGINLVIYEEMPQNISDEQQFNRWIDSHKREKVIKLPSSQDEAPEDIDYKHIHYRELILAGLLSLKDKVYLQYMGDVLVGFPNTVKTRNLFDRAELQGKGIGSSFYQHLEGILRELSFQYLAGEVVSPHPGFFEKTRQRVQDLTPSQQMEIPPQELSQARYLVKGLL